MTTRRTTAADRGKRLRRSASAPTPVASASHAPPTDVPRPHCLRLVAGEAHVPVGLLPEPPSRTDTPERVSWTRADVARRTSLAPWSHAACWRSRSGCQAVPSRSRCARARPATSGRRSRSARKPLRTVDGRSVTGNARVGVERRGHEGRIVVRFPDRKFSVPPTIFRRFRLTDSRTAVVGRARRNRGRCEILRSVGFATLTGRGRIGNISGAAGDPHRVTRQLARPPSRAVGARLHADTHRPEPGCERRAISVGSEQVSRGATRSGSAALPNHDGTSIDRAADQGGPARRNDAHRTDPTPRLTRRPRRWPRATTSDVRPPLTEILGRRPPRVLCASVFSGQGPPLECVGAALGGRSLAGVWGPGPDFFNAQPRVGVRPAMRIEKPDTSCVAVRAVEASRVAVRGIAGRGAASGGSELASSCDGV